MRKDPKDPAYLRQLLRRVLDYWALPDTSMPDPDFFDEINKACGWRGPRETKDGQQGPHKQP